LGRATPRLAANKKLSAWFDIALFAPLHRQNGPQMRRGVVQMGQKWHKAEAFHPKV